MAVLRIDSKKRKSLDEIVKSAGKKLKEMEEKFLTGLKYQITILVKKFDNKELNQDSFLEELSKLAIEQEKEYGDSGVRTTNRIIGQFLEENYGENLLGEYLKKIKEEKIPDQIYI